MTKKKVKSQFSDNYTKTYLRFSKQGLKGDLMLP